MSDWKRAKEIPSRTENIELESGCGTLHLILGFEEELDKDLIEVRANIGKSGICCNVMLDSLAKIISIALQSDMPRYKLCKKIKKQLTGVVCNQGKSCIDVIASRIVKELEA